MIDTPSVIDEILAGDALTQSQGARTLPAHRGKGVAPSTLWRWHRQGVRTPDGRRVYLEMARVGAKWCTSRAALARFIAASTPSIPESTVEPYAAPRTEKQHILAAELAGRELKKIGI